MAKRKPGTKKAKQAADGQNGGIVSLTKELFQAAIKLRGSVEPARALPCCLAHVEGEVASRDAKFRAETIPR